MALATIGRHELPTQAGAAGWSRRPAAGHVPGTQTVAGALAVIMLGGCAFTFPGRTLRVRSAEVSRESSVERAPTADASLPAGHTVTITRHLDACTSQETVQLREITVRRRRRWAISGRLLMAGFAVGAAGFIAAGAVRRTGGRDVPFDSSCGGPDPMDPECLGLTRGTGFLIIGGGLAAASIGMGLTNLGTEEVGGGEVHAAVEPAVALACDGNGGNPGVVAIGGVEVGRVAEGETLEVDLTEPSIAAAILAGEPIISIDGVVVGAVDHISAQESIVAAARECSAPTIDQRPCILAEVVSRSTHPTAENLRAVRERALAASAALAAERARREATEARQALALRCQPEDQPAPRPECLDLTNYTGMPGERRRVDQLVAYDRWYQRLPESDQRREQEIWLQFARAHETDLRAQAGPSALLEALARAREREAAATVLAQQQEAATAAEVAWRERCGAQERTTSEHERDLRSLRTQERLLGVCRDAWTAATPARERWAAHAPHRALSGTWVSTTRDRNGHYVVLEVAGYSPDYGVYGGAYGICTNPDCGMWNIENALIRVDTNGSLSVDTMASSNHIFPHQYRGLHRGTFRVSRSGAGTLVLDGLTFQKRSDRRVEIVR